jgi:hypothetical protein
MYISIFYVFIKNFMKKLTFFTACAKKKPHEGANYSVAFCLFDVGRTKSCFLLKRFCEHFENI